METLVSVAVRIAPELRARVADAAKQSSRSVAGQLRFLITREYAQPSERATEDSPHVCHPHY
jgi:hypothetical protein